MEKLTPGALNGIKQTIFVEVSQGEKEFEIEVRPLRHSEAAQIQGLLSKGLKVKQGAKGDSVTTDNVDIDMAVTVQAQFDAQLKASALGTTDPAWTEKAIDEQWPSEWIVKVGDAVMSISGIGNAKEVEQFRKD